MCVDEDKKHWINGWTRQIWMGLRELVKRRKKQEDGGGGDGVGECIIPI